MFQQVRNPSAVAPNRWEVPSGRVNLQGLVGNLNLYSSVELGGTGPTGPAGPVPEGNFPGDYLVWSESGAYDSPGDRVILGRNAGGTIYRSDDTSIRIGKNAGSTGLNITFPNTSIAIGENAGKSGQGINSVAIGRNSGDLAQGVGCVSIGALSGRHQEEGSVAIGNFACGDQNNQCIAIGQGAGGNTQTFGSIAIGGSAGGGAKQDTSIAIGFYSGQNQSTGSICIGYYAGQFNTRENVILIGNYIPGINTPANSIIISASGSANNIVTDPVNSGLYIQPIASTNDNPTNLLHYNPVTKEIKYTTGKTFVIDHPVEESRYLVHSCLEGPEAGVYYRGTNIIPPESDSIEISLPSYVSKFAYDLTVQLTSIYGGSTNLQTTDVDNEGKFRVYGTPGRFNWLVLGKRGEVLVEPLKEEIVVKGDGPYKWIA